jgi:hypothetical protein
MPSYLFLYFILTIIKFKKGMVRVNWEVEIENERIDM